MNYQHFLQNFLEDYATAIFGSAEIIVTCETDYEDGLVRLIANKGSQATILLEYSFRDNHGLDESDGETNPQYIICKPPMEFISQSSDTEMYRKIFGEGLLRMFGRYCNVFSINYVLGNIPFTIKSESAPDKAMSILHNGLSTKYRKIFVNPSCLERCCEVYLENGDLFAQVLIENVEEI